MAFSFKKAFTPPKSKNNIIKAAAAPFTGGLSFLAPNAAVEAAKRATKYAGVITQSIVAPVLPKNVQRKVFGLNKTESGITDALQWVSRAVFAVAGGKALLAPKAAPAAASKLPGWLQPQQQPANYVEVAPKSPIFSSVPGPTDYVSLPGSAASSAATKAAVAAASGTKGAAASSWISKLKDKASDVLTTGLLVLGARQLQGGGGGEGQAGGGTGSSGGGGGAFPFAMESHASPAGGGDIDADNRARIMVTAVLFVTLAAAAYFFVWRRK